MAITSGFFDSVSGDRTYDAEQMSNYFDGLVSNGVYENVGDRFLVSAGSGMTVNVGSGRAIIQCRWVKNDDTASLSFDPADATYNRIDAVVLRLDYVSRSITLTVKKGTANASPVMPDITRNENIYELYLATVQINRGATSVSGITDLRPSTYCGWVTGIIQQVDTADLFLQWQTAYETQYNQFATFIAEKEAAFNEWFLNLTGQLRVDASLTKICYRESVAAYSTGCPVPSEYNSGTDVMLVFVNGVYYAEGKDYDIIQLPHVSNLHVRFASGKSPQVSSNVDFVLLRTIVGQGVIAGGLTQMSVNAPRALTAGQIIHIDL